MEPVQATTSFSVVLIIVLVAAVVLLLLGLILYVMESMALYQMARRRKVKGALLAWLPVLWMWLLGRLSDQYRANAKLTRTHRGATVLVLLLLTVLAAVVTGVVMGISAAGTVLPDMLTGEYLFAIMAGSAGMLAVLAVIVFVLQIVVWVCLYDVYAASRPGGAVAFLLLTLLLPVLRPVLVFACRRHDKGLPLPVDPPVEVPVAPATPVVVEPVTEVVAEQTVIDVEN